MSKTQSVAAQLAAVTEQNFTFLMKRFDRIEVQNDEQLKLLRDHIEKDEKAHKILERHSTYFGILSLGIPVAIATLMNKMGFKPL